MQRIYVRVYEYYTSACWLLCRPVFAEHSSLLSRAREQGFRVGALDPLSPLGLEEDDRDEFSSDAASSSSASASRPSSVAASPAHALVSAQVHVLYTYE